MNLISQQKEALESQVNELNQKLGQKDTELFKNSVGSEFMQEVSKLKFKKNIPEGILKTHLDTVRNTIADKAKRQEDKLYFYEGEKAILNDKLEPASMADMVSKSLADVIDTGHQANGTRIGQEPFTGDDGTINTVAIKSQMDLTRALKEAGKVAGTQEYNELKEKYIKELGLQNKIR